ncbi:MAG: OmpH family outer membrane protein [Succinivibrio sp.]
MYKKLFLASALSLALTAPSMTFAAENTATEAKAESAAKENISIAVVNIRLIMSELPQAKKAAEEMQKEFAPRADELKKIQQEGMTLEKELQEAKGDKAVEIQRKLAKLKSDFDLKNQALQEDSQRKEREHELKLGRLIQTAIDRIAKERGIALVVRGESVVYASSAVDISNEVIARASKLKPASEVKAKKESKEAAK